jgi:hypothetical protein
MKVMMRKKGQNQKKQKKQKRRMRGKRRDWSYGNARRGPSSIVP